MDSSWICLHCTTIETPKKIINKLLKTSWNKKRQPAKRWNEAKIERTVNKYTDDFIGNVYDKLYKGVKANRNTPRDKWIEFIETNEILDSLEESVSMMEIGED